MKNMVSREQPRQIEIDPFFDAPSSLRGVKYSEGTRVDVDSIGVGDSEELGDLEPSYDNMGDDDYIDNNYDDDSDMEGGLPVPETIEILSQTVRQGSGGATTVDVVISTPNLPGVSDFEVRIDKA